MFSISINGGSPPTCVYFVSLPVLSSATSILSSLSSLVSHFPSFYLISPSTHHFFKAFSKIKIKRSLAWRGIIVLVRRRPQRFIVTLGGDGPFWRAPRPMLPSFNPCPQPQTIAQDVFGTLPGCQGARITASTAKATHLQNDENNPRQKTRMVGSMLQVARPVGFTLQQRENRGGPSHYANGCCASSYPHRRHPFLEQFSSSRPLLRETAIKATPSHRVFSCNSS